jgi:tyrosinase
VSLTRSLTDALFVGQGTGSNPGFGGPRTKFNHIGGDQPMGYLEQVPHGSMHVAVGPWMGNSFTTAALDPIFWLHHGNIDRLWSVWLGRNPTTHLNPPDDQWKTPPAPGFEFHDANGNVVSLTPQQVVDSTASPLNYQYEDQSDPLAGTPDARVPRRAPVLGLQAEPMSEMVGATERPFALAGQSTTAQVRVSRPSGPALLGMQSPDELPDRVYLNIENITGVHPKTSYAVYVNLPSGANPEQHQELFAGLLPMFGVTEASRTQGDHSGSGLHYSLDITDVVRGLRARNAWDPNTMRVTFVPEHPARAPQAQPQGGLGIAAPEPEGVQVGRVSLYYGSSET